MKHKLLLVYSWLVRTALFFLPDIPFFMRFRGWLYGLGMAKRGRDFQVTHDVVIKDLQGISVGKHVFVGNHSSQNGSYRYGKGNVGHIHIGRGSWVAGNCTVQKDSALPANSVLSANSFLNKVFTEEDAVYGGVPAKLLKKLDNA